MNRRRERSPVPFKFSSRCTVSTPTATNSTPSLPISDRSFSPLSSMKVTSLRSTIVGASNPTWRRCCQHARNSATHGLVNCPHRISLCSVSVSACVIRNMPLASVHSPGQWEARVSLARNCMICQVIPDLLENPVTCRPCKPLTRVRFAAGLSAPALHACAGNTNAESLHSRLQRGALDSQSSRGPVWSANNPIGLLKRRHNLLTLRVVE